MTDTAGFWFKYDCGEGQLPESELRKALETLSIRLNPYEDSNPRRAGLFLFDRVDGALESALGQCCRESPQRVIAVYLGKRRLTLEDGILLLSQGVADILAWHSVPDPLAVLASRFARWQRVDRALSSSWVRAHLAGTSPAWMKALRLAAEAALFSRAPILVLGETGTGKELISRLIHELDPRSDKGDLTVLDCATIVPGLSGSEFFGHEKGAFTHAVSSREGAIAMADKGTLFLDEIGELPYAEQAGLLRAIQEKSIKKVGSQEWRSVDYRLVCATNRNLLEEIGKGRFRNDLYHRLAGWIIPLPSLKDRQEDILPLSRHFAREILGTGDRVEIDPYVQEFLLTREYPGNIRELRQLVHLMASRCGEEGPITLGDIPPSTFAPHSSSQPPLSGWAGCFNQAVQVALIKGMTLREITRMASDQAVEQALKREGSLQGAADRLGVCRRTLELRRSEKRQASRDAPEEELSLQKTPG